MNLSLLLGRWRDINSVVWEGWEVKLNVPNTWFVNIFGVLELDLDWSWSPHFMVLDSSPVWNPKHNFCCQMQHQVWQTEWSICKSKAHLTCTGGISTFVDLMILLWLLFFFFFFGSFSHSFYVFIIFTLSVWNKFRLRSEYFIWCFR